MCDYGCVGVEEGMGRGLNQETEHPYNNKNPILKIRGMIILLLSLLSLLVIMMLLMNQL